MDRSSYSTPGLVLALRRLLASTAQLFHYWYLKDLTCYKHSSPSPMQSQQSVSTQHSHTTSRHNQILPWRPHPLRPRPNTQTKQLLPPKRHVAKKPDAPASRCETRPGPAATYLDSCWRGPLYLQRVSL
eukprot:710422-Hanusia_phi.AAC.1